ncbi:MAG: peptidylprolyl isomerase [Acidobacteria bacterium]|nr:peptidylprolyl isomerase [Acidobacteriota bacterium]
MDPRILIALALSAAPMFSQTDVSKLTPGEVEAVVTTDLGTFRFEFLYKQAPQHVKHFIQAAREGYYDGGAFHWAKANAAIQGGDPQLKDPSTPRERWGSGGLNLMPTEINDVKHRRGIVSGFRLLSRKDSDSSQFFICVAPQRGLDGKYSAFGSITEGMDVVDQISRVPADSKGYVEKLVRITSIRIEKKKPAPFDEVKIADLKRTVTMKTTLGTIKIQMQPEWAPNHVRNFLNLVSAGWYDGTPFHRLVHGFVAQGGIGQLRNTGPDHPADRWVHQLAPEFNAMRHFRGSVSMARTDDPNSASTSFFLVLGPAPHLDGNYSQFGKVIEGLEVLDAFNKEKTSGETPKRKLELIEAKIDPQ